MKGGAQQQKGNDRLPSTASLSTFPRTLDPSPLHLAECDLIILLIRRPDLPAHSEAQRASGASSGLAFASEVDPRRVDELIHCIDAQG